MLLFQWQSNFSKIVTSYALIACIRKGRQTHPISCRHTTIVTTGLIVLNYFVRMTGKILKHRHHESFSFIVSRNVTLQRSLFIIIFRAQNRRMKLQVSLQYTFIYMTLKTGQMKRRPSVLIHFHSSLRIGPRECLDDILLQTTVSSDVKRKLTKLVLKEEGIRLMYDNLTNNVKGSIGVDRFVKNGIFYGGGWRLVS